MTMGRQFSHERKHCPVQGCMEHRWPVGMDRRDLEGPVERAMVGVRRPDVRGRSSSGTGAVAFEIAASEINAAVQQLSNVMAEQRGGKLDGRQVIADGKRRRRELISQVGRYGMNSL